MFWYKVWLVFFTKDSELEFIEQIYVTFWVWFYKKIDKNINKINFAASSIIKY